MVVEVYTDDPELQVVIVDWDCQDGDYVCVVADEWGHEYSGLAAEFPPSAMDAMPVETRRAFDHAAV
jgi:hypothetical protein